MKKKETKTLKKQVKEEGVLNKGIRFLKEVKIEAKKITWPQKKQVLGTAVMVIIFSLLIGGYLGLLDAIYNVLISFLVR